VAAAAAAAAAAASQEKVGFVLEEILASKIFATLLQSSAACTVPGSIGGNGGSGDGYMLLEVLQEVINFRNISALCSAFSGVIICPSIHVASARTAGEITALHTVHLLHLLQTPHHDDEFKSALEHSVSVLQQQTSDSRVAQACIDQLLITLCMRAHGMPLEQHALAISGQNPRFALYFSPNIHSGTLHLPHIHTSCNSRLD
jgi:hypothetical protein